MSYGFESYSADGIKVLTLNEKTTKILTVGQFQVTSNSTRTPYRIVVPNYIWALAEFYFVFNIASLLTSVYGPSYCVSRVSTREFDVYLLGRFGSGGISITGSIVDYQVLIA